LSRVRRAGRSSERCFHRSSIYVSSGESAAKRETGFVAGVLWLAGEFRKSRGLARFHCHLSPANQTGAGFRLPAKTLRKTNVDSVFSTDAHEQINVRPCHMFFLPK
jgi:hypothetical protein